MDVQSSRKHNQEHCHLWLLLHFSEVYTCQLEPLQLYFRQGNICILFIYLLLAVSSEEFAFYFLSENQPSDVSRMKWLSWPLDSEGQNISDMADMINTH